jgi:hypothetical protein
MMSGDIPPKSTPGLQMARSSIRQRLDTPLTELGTPSGSEKTGGDMREIVKIS